MPDNQSRITDNSVRAGFTLLELLIVLGIMITLIVLVLPAFTNRKSADDLTSAAYTIKGVLETARTYAQANNTYTWVGFYEEDGSVPSVVPAPDPCTGCVGRLVISAVASKAGTNLGADVSSSASGTENFIDPTQLTQVTKLVKIDNVHSPLFFIPTAVDCSTVACDTFDTRPAVQNDGGSIGYNASRFGELNASPPNTAPYDSSNNGLTKFPFQYPVGSPAPSWQYRFRRTIRFTPTGENRLNSTYDIRQVVEAGLIQTHANVTPVPAGSPGTSTVVFSGNVLAVQIGGLDGNVKIYRR